MTESECAHEDDLDRAGDGRADVAALGSLLRDPGSAAICRSRTNGFPGKWGPISKECSCTSPASGWDGTLRITWNVQVDTNQCACVVARMGKASNPDEWQSLGCGTRGVGEVKWPKNTASMVEVRVRSGNAANVDCSS
ncbi:hypothetical protein [Saccharopolyspora rhizosphaerae]|uniref:hypothetical protein n=1 Tax=Saccharopolyspora rhizosphaerae TaxID=2492662 RepID=UPI0018F7653D|nr:hypothetical protein [Saccharopolyspora rhizosphaerae]